MYCSRFCKRTSGACLCASVSSCAPNGSAWLQRCSCVLVQIPCCRADRFFAAGCRLVRLHAAGPAMLGLAFMQQHWRTSTNPPATAMSPSSWRPCTCSFPNTMWSTYALQEPAVAVSRTTSACWMHSKCLRHGVLTQFQGQPLLAARGAGLGSDALRQGWTLIPDDSIAAEVWQTLSSKVSCQIHRLVTPVSISITPEF